MKVRYIATDDPSDDATCTVFGLTFEKGKAVEVPDDIYARLETNQTFEVIKPRKTEG
jgi:hypothetical protein